MITTLFINSINILQLNFYSVVLQSSTSEKITLNSIISYSDSSVKIQSDCDIYSTNIRTIYPQANVYLLNESVEIKCIYVTSDYVPIIVTSNVYSLDLLRIIVEETSDYLNTGLFIIEESSSDLTFGSTPTFFDIDPILLMLQKNRTIISDLIHCDNQAVMINYDVDSCDVLNLYNHYCTELIDYSCPCNSQYSNCTVELDGYSSTSSNTFHQENPTTLIIVNKYSFLYLIGNITFQANSDVTTNFRCETEIVVSVSNYSTDFKFTTYTTYSSFILIGNSSIGFSEDNYYISNSYPCKALLFNTTINDFVCLICDAEHNIDGYCTDTLNDIYHCKNQTEYGCEECDDPRLQIQ
ncbi:hypothetical protein QTN25_002438 [Entamoeba marina]